MPHCDGEFSRGADVQGTYVRGNSQIDVRGGVHAVTGRDGSEHLDASLNARRGDTSLSLDASRDTDAAGARRQHLGGTLQTAGGTNITGAEDRTAGPNGVESTNRTAAFNRGNVAISANQSTARDVDGTTTSSYGGAASAGSYSGDYRHEERTSADGSSTTSDSGGLRRAHGSAESAGIYDDRLRVTHETSRSADGATSDSWTGEGKMGRLEGTAAMSHRVTADGQTTDSQSAAGQYGTGRDAITAAINHDTMASTTGASSESWRGSASNGRASIEGAMAHGVADDGSVSASQSGGLTVGRGEMARQVNVTHTSTANADGSSTDAWEGQGRFGPTLSGDYSQSHSVSAAGDVTDAQAGGIKHGNGGNARSLHVGRETTTGADGAHSETLKGAGQSGQLSGSYEQTNGVDAAGTTTDSRTGTLGLGTGDRARTISAGQTTSRGPDGVASSETNVGVNYRGYEGTLRNASSVDAEGTHNDALSLGLSHGDSNLSASRTQARNATTGANSETYTASGAHGQLSASGSRTTGRDAEGNSTSSLEGRAAHSQRSIQTAQSSRTSADGSTAADASYGLTIGDSSVGVTTAATLSATGDRREQRAITGEDTGAGRKLSLSETTDHGADGSHSTARELHGNVAQGSVNVAHTAAAKADGTTSQSLVTDGAIGQHTGGYSLQAVAQADGSSSLTHNANASVRGVDVAGQTSATTGRDGTTRQQHSLQGSARGHSAKLLADDENGVEFLVDSASALSTDVPE